ncbi:uncharacterized protein LOC131949278 [Physella acuta]|uniref:uncharacterized protein LOC131949278 n=1 Tax=Physella acuta TaxID=109671 RepID=UPI0027DAB751|nr:uncharacterized protein LOC131949278 [Physella acuta]
MYKLGLLLLVVVGYVSASATSCGPNTLDKFVSILCGNYSNLGDIKKDVRNRSHDHIQIEFVPVNIPALYPASSLYHTFRRNGVIIRQHIWVCSLNTFSYVVCQPYNITVPVLDQDGEIDYNAVSDLDYTVLDTNMACTITWRTVEFNLFFGFMPDCTNYYGGPIASYGVHLSCNALSSVTYLDLFPEKSNNAPYIVWKIDSCPSMNNNTSEDDYNKLCSC